MIEPWVITVVSILTSILFGGFAGGVLTILYNRKNSRDVATRKERAVIAALAAEIKRCLSIVDYNSIQNGDHATFQRFPTNVAQLVISGEQYSYPLLQTLQINLGDYNTIICYLNQLVDLHSAMWSSFDLRHTYAYRDKIKDNILNICNERIGIKIDARLQDIRVRTFMNKLLLDVERLGGLKK